MSKAEGNIRRIQLLVRGSINELLLEELKNCSLVCFCFIKNYYFKQTETFETLRRDEANDHLEVDISLNIFLFPIRPSIP